MPSTRHRTLETDPRPADVPAPLAHREAAPGGRRHRARRASPTGRARLAVAAFAILVAACAGDSADKDLVTARQALFQGEVQKAMVAAKSHLEARPESPAGRYLLGRALLAAGDLQGAEVELKRAESLRHTEDELVPALAELSLARGEPRDVVTRFEGKKLTDAAAEAQLLTLLAQAQRELGNPEKAQRTVDAALKKKPGNEPAVILGARLAADRGESDAAMAVATSLTSRPDASSRAWLLQGDLLAAQRGDALKPAVEAYRKAVSIDPRLVEAQIGLVTSLLALGDLEAAHAQVAATRKQLPGRMMVDYLDGLVAYLRGDLGRAREMVDALVSAADPIPAVHLLAGVVHSRLGNVVQAEAGLEAAIAAQPQWVEPRLEMALLQLRLGRPDKALAALEPAIAAHPSDPALWATLGQVQVRRGDFRQADAAFARAQALRPGDPAVRGAMARSLIDRGRLDAGLRLLEDAAAADVDGIGNDLVLVAAQVRAGNRPAALKALDAAERKQPRAALPTYLRGKLLEDAGDRPGARASYEAAVAKDPRSLPMVAALAELDFADFGPEAARRRYEALVKADPNQAAARLALADALLRGGARVSEVSASIDASVRVAPKDVGNWIAAIRLQRSLGDPRATLSRVQAANHAVADHPAIQIELAAAHGAAGEVEQAIATLLGLTRSRPGWAEGHFRLAMTFGGAGQFASAREPLQKAFALAPESPEVLRAVIAHAVQDGDPARARAVARGIQERQPREPIGWDLQAEAEMLLGNNAMAVTMRREALERGPTPERALALHRDLLSGDPAAARQFAEDWLKTHPKDVLFVSHLGEAAQKAGDAARAEARYRQAIALQPGNAFALNNLAELLLERKDPGALALAQRAAALAPGLPAVLDTLASAQAQAGLRDQAVQSAQRAAELLPVSGMLRWHLARYLYARGDTGAARDELARALRLGLPAAQQREAEALQKKLGG